MALFCFIVRVKNNLYRHVQQEGFRHVNAFIADIVTTVIVIAIFVIIVSIHEFGHFIASKVFGVPVLEYSVGMGKVLWTRVWRGTRYSFRALPIGGYVIPAGQTALFQVGKPIAVGVDNDNVIQIAGPLRRRLRRFWTGRVFLLSPRKIAQDGTIIDRNGEEFTVADSARQILYGYAYPMDEHGQRVIDLSVWKQWVVFAAGAFMNLLLAYILAIIAALVIRGGNPVVIPKAIEFVNSIIGISVQALPHIITKHGINHNLGGAVYMVSQVHLVLVTMSGVKSVASLLLFGTLFSVGIGLFNRIPIPPLDGFHIVRATVELVVQIPYRVLIGLSFLGLTCLIVLSIIVNYNNLFLGMGGT